MESPLESLEKAIREAEELAERVSADGRVLGHITRVSPVEVEEDKRLVWIEIPFQEYVKADDIGVFSIGGLLGIVNPLAHNIVLGRIVGYRREDLLSIMNIRAIHYSMSDLSTLQTPLTLRVELIAEAEVQLNNREIVLGEPRPALTPLEPGSPVIMPSSDVTLRLLGLPSEGTVVGYLAAGNIVLKNVLVRLPLEALYHHVLVVGTTGSGKTVLLKNIALSLSHEFDNVKPTIIAFDLQGDYLDLLFPNNNLGDEVLYKPLDELTVVLPITSSYMRQLNSIIDSRVDRSDVKTVDELKQVVGEVLGEDYVDKTFGGLGLSMGEINVDLSVRDNGGKRYVVEGIDVELIDHRMDRRILLKIKPFSLVYQTTRDDLGKFMPIFTEQARLFIPTLLRDMGVKYMENIINKIKQSSDRDIARRYRVAQSTIGNIGRGLILLHDTGLFDVRVKKRGLELWFDEPDYRRLYDAGGIVVVDLRWANLYSNSPYTETIIVYRLLTKLFEYKDEVLRSHGELNPTIVLIDEAHNYFPQAGREGYNKDLMETIINKITRLGRVRRIGVVFATHQPNDLNNLIIQLTNTKIALRSNKKTLEAIELAEYAPTLRNAPNGYAIIVSHVYRTQVVETQIIPPQTRHKSP